MAPTLVWGKYAITKGCKDIEAAIAFFDVVHTDEYSELISWGVEDLTFVRENGVRMLKDSMNNEERAKARNTTGSPLYGDTVFPRIQCPNLESALNNLTNLDQKYKADFQVEYMGYKPRFYNFNDNFLAMPDENQLSEKSRIQNDINTYSSELATNLALGKASLDNWDSYINDLKELGLDKLIEINQQLHDRYNSISIN
jgi:putative aldouronate transport system substrate-binding protein